MKYRAVRIDEQLWAVQWRVAYVFRGLEPDMRYPPVLGPHTMYWPVKLTFPTQAAAETHIYEILEQARRAKEIKKNKGPWLPEVYL